MKDEPPQGVKRLKTKDVLSPKESADGDELQFFTTLRPTTLDEYIGQRQVVENLQISIEAAKSRSEPLDHILFHGPPGLGKTTLAYIIAKEMNSHLTLTSGPTLERPADLMGILTKLQEKDVLFIDEIHRLPRIVEEFLYPAIEDFKVDFILDKGPHARTVRFNLKHFTLIGATTRAGLLTAPLRERFGIFHHLDFYDEADLITIVKRSAGMLKVPTDQDGAREIARRARGTPRIANRLLRRVRDYATVKGKGIIDKAIADKALLLLGVDELGLDDLDRRFLQVVIENYDGGPVGINAISATIHEEEDTLIDVIEPYLLKIGFINRSSRGRIATKSAYQHLDYIYKDKSADEQLNIF